jgi:hypothetical protein
MLIDALNMNEPHWYPLVSRILLFTLSFLRLPRLKLLHENKLPSSILRFGIVLKLLGRSPDNLLTSNDTDTVLSSNEKWDMLPI